MKVSQDPKPRGREAVQRALLEAAARLFVEHGPSAVSVREIAAAAGVNHGLVHQYFGSKEGLVRATLEHLASELRPVAASAADVPSSLYPLLDALNDREAFVRLLGWLLLEGAEPNALPTEFPVVRAMLGRIEGELDGAPTRLEPRVMVAAFISMAFGWLVFKRYIVVAANLQDRDDAELVEAMSALLVAMSDWNRRPT